MRGGQGVGGDSRWAVPPGRASGEGIVLLLPAGGTKNKRSKSVPSQRLASSPSLAPRPDFSCTEMASGPHPDTSQACCPHLRLPLPPASPILGHPHPSLLSAPSLHPPSLPSSLPSLHPSSLPPRSLLGALAGLLLTKESLDLRHPLRPALSREERGGEGPRPPKGGCPVEGGMGKGGRGEVVTAAEAICPRINSVASCLSLHLGSGVGPSLR